MSGYLVFPRQALDLYGGVVPAAGEQIAFFDFLREIEQEPFPFAPRARLCVTGLDELLVLLGCTERRAGPNELALLQDYKRRLKRADVEIGSLATIQVPIAHKPVLGGDKMLAAYHTAIDCVLLWRIFGLNPTNRGDIGGGHIAYHFGETLS